MQESELCVRLKNINYKKERRVSYLIDSSHCKYELKKSSLNNKFIKTY